MQRGVLTAQDGPPDLAPGPEALGEPVHDERLEVLPRPLDGCGVAEHDDRAVTDRCGAPELLGHDVDQRVEGVGTDDDALQVERDGELPVQPERDGGEPPAQFERRRPDL